MATAISIPYSPRGYYLRPNEVEIPVEEYLRSSYSPDMDYVDGHLEERDLGEFDHSLLQRALMKFFLIHESDWSVLVLPECRVQVKPENFRVPDLTILRRGQPVDHIIRTPPLLCVEVLSPDDTFRRLQARVDDYVAMGVRDVWVMNAETGRVFVVTNGRQQFTDERVLTVPGTSIAVDLDQIKADMDAIRIANEATSEEN